MRPKPIPRLLEGIVVVLDRPRDVTNVGAVVRAMGNFGLSRLRLVEPAAYDVERIRSMAHRGEPILERLERHATLDGALADCGFVLATTARPRAVRHERMTPRQAASALVQAAARGAQDASGAESGHAPGERHAAALSAAGPPAAGPPAAVLFGPEDRGLTNEAIGRCNAVITIPTAPDNPSLNLAQSVLLIAYELWLAATASATPLRVPDAAAAVAPVGDSGLAGHDSLAPVAVREEMFAALEKVLWGMHPNNDAGRVSHTLARLRAVLSRAAPRTEEVQMLMRLFIHIAHERDQ